MNIYLLFDKFLFFFLAIFNAISRLYFFLNPKISCIVKKNMSIKRNTDECFIFGNGPSLRNLDINLIKNRDTFSCNFFYNMDEFKFETTYFVAIDQNFYIKNSYIEYIKRLHRNHPNIKMFLKYSSLYIKSLDDNNVYFIYAKQFQYGDFVSCDITKNMTACINVVIQCIQIAISLGYKRIYLLGCEFNQYAQLTSAHASNNYPANGRDGSMGSYARWYSMAHFHNYALRKYADVNGIQIINLTPNSLIDAFNKDTLESISMML